MKHYACRAEGYKCLVIGDGTGLGEELSEPGF